MTTHTDKQKLWNDFLTRWTQENVEKMEYHEYSSKGSHDTFCYWLEFKTQKLGNISGSTAFKFGVYSRSKDAEISKRTHLMYSETDAWQKRFGISAEDAFLNVKRLILEIIKHAQKGNLEAIQKSQLSSMVKWKIAFLYQNQDSLCISNIFTPAALQLYTGEKSSEMFKLNKKLFESLTEPSISNLFELGDKILEYAAKHKEEISETGYLLPQSKNIILYGPPGTGKTHALINGTVEGLEFVADLPDSQVRSVTFHPSYGYEDFVEGIQPVLTEDEENAESTNIQYVMRNGVFREIVHQAELDNIRDQAEIKDELDTSTANVWKMSLGNTATEEGTTIFKHCIKSNEVLLGFVNKDISEHIATASSFTDYLYEQNYKSSVVSMMRQFIFDMKVGDLIFVTKGNKGGIRAIGQLTGEYKFIPEHSFHHRYRHARSIKWIWHNNDNPIKATTLLTKSVSQRTIYSLNGRLNEEELERLFSKKQENEQAVTKNYVLKIDEINRGNVSKIFGELITLIEEDKREYPIQLASGATFSVPENLFIIGTMNTADRSLTHLDTALRRRFHFIEMMPQPTLLENTIISGIDLTELLTSMNQRMEALLDREHTIGHGYFMQNAKVISTTEELQHVIMNKVLPQLQEYFFDDYAQIQMILGKEIVRDFTLAVPSSFPIKTTYRIDQLGSDKFIEALKKEYPEAKTKTEELQERAS
ncbi:AAA family ATPase [Halodesulfovibrio spirochaetisodalis]|uniref:AAA family ATPase n=1 Tax=Halodesulfovibrio spirochaetisodalis TaxID=1560234 RepID=UPI00082D84C7|nr:AAA family ATPase [Halodesulfovibrio spirochaetisodalis]